MSTKYLGDEDSKGEYAAKCLPRLQAAPPAPAPISDEQLDELHGAMSDEQMTALARLRGGCSCHISPPCNACVEPLTEEEAISLGLLPDEPPPAPVAHSKSEYKRRVAMGDANVLPPAPVAVQPAPVAWQWRRKGDPWTLEKTFNSEVFATTADSEVRALYASPSPAPVAAPVVTDAQIDEASERKAFEAWASDQGFLMQRTVHGEDYQDLRTQGPWEAWQARAILAAQSGAGTRGEQT